jgi:CRP-like cAMP-binding protein
MSLVEAVNPSTSSRYLPLPPATSAWSAGAEGDLAVLRRGGSKIRFSRGETIFNEGDPADFAYSVVSGAVRLCKHTADGRRQIAQFLLPGDFFSFMAMDEHSFAAEAADNTVVACYPQRQIERMTEERPALRRYFGSLLACRVKDVQNQLVTLGRQTAKERVASFLVMLVERAGAEDGSRIDLPMSRQDIADFLGLTIETVCRMLSSMKRSKLLDVAGAHELIIRDSDRLYALAEGDES